MNGYFLIKLSSLITGFCIRLHVIVVVKSNYRISDERKRDIFDDEMIA